MAKQTPASIDDLLTQSKITNRLLAAQLREKMTQKDLVKLLMSTDASDKDIADILDTTPATVSNTKVRLRKNSPKTARTPKEEAIADGGN